MRNFSIPRWSRVVDTVRDITLSTDQRQLRAYKTIATEPAPRPKVNWLVQKGFGMTKYSLFHPLGRNSNTTYKVLKRFWPERVGSAQNDDISSLAQPEYDEQCFSSLPINIDPTLVNFLSKLPRNDFQTGLLRKCNIKFSNPKTTDALLLNELNLCKQKFKDKGINEASAQVPLLLGIRRACDDVALRSGKPVTEAHVARSLAYLRELDVFASLLHSPLKSNTAGLDKNERIAQDLAWRIVYKMAITENGMELLSKLTNVPTPPVGVPNNSENNRRRRQHLNLKHFFLAADNLLTTYVEQCPESRQRPLLADPSALLTYCCEQCENEDPPLNTLLIHGLPGIQQVMCEEEKSPPRSFWNRRIEHTAKSLKKNGVVMQTGTNRIPSNSLNGGLPGNHDASVSTEIDKQILLRARQEFAMQDRFAYKWVSDGHYSNAPGSVLYNANERLKKIEVHLERRAERHAKTPREAFLKRARDIPLGRNRSFVPQRWIASDQHNPGSMPLHREFMKDALLQMEELMLRDKRLANCAGSGPVASGDTLEAAQHQHQLLLQHIARLALIRHWINKSPHQLSNGVGPDESAITNGIFDESLQQIFGDNLSLNDAQRKELIAASREKVPTDPLTPELLELWVNDIALNTPLNDKKSRAPIVGRDLAEFSNDHVAEKFEELINNLKNGHRSSLVPTGDPVQDFKNGIADDIKHMRLGNTRNLSGGGAHGFYVPVVSHLFSMVKTAGLFQLKSNASVSHRKTANFEVGLPSSGGFIRFTGANDTEAAAGVTGTVGPKFNLGFGKFGFFGTTGVEGSYNTGSAKGVSLSLPRGGSAMTGRDGVKAGVSGDADVAKRLAKISLILTDLGDAPPIPNDPFPTMRKLRRIAEVAPDISVSSIQPEDSYNKDNNLNARVGGQANVVDQSEKYGLNAYAYGNAGYSFRRKNYRQRDGALDVEVINRGVRKSLSVTARAALLLGLDKKHGAYTEFDNADTSVTKIVGTPLGALSANAELWKSGKSIQTTRIIYDGKISKNCYTSIYYQNLKESSAAAEKNISKWVNYAAFYDPDCPAFTVTANKEVNEKDAIKVREIRRELVKRHTKTFHEYWAHAKQTVQPSNIYFDFLELTPESTEMLNKYYQLEMELRAAGCSDEADGCKKAFDAVWNHPNAWTPHYLVTSLPQQSSSGFSLNFGATIASEQGDSSTTYPNYWGG